MTKRGIDQCDEVEYAFHEETGADGVSFNVGCDCLQHSADIDWIQCTQPACDIWFCIKAVIADYGLNKQELKVLMKDDHLFKCRIHEIPELDLRKCIQESMVKKSNIPYNLRKRSKPSAEVKEIESEDDDIFEILKTNEMPQSFKTFDEDDEDDDIFKQFIRENENLDTKKKKPTRKRKTTTPKKKKPKKGKPKEEKATTRRQMDMIRYSTMKNRKIDEVKDKIVDVGRRFSKYLRDDEYAKKLIQLILENMKKKGRTFGSYKDDQVCGGWNTHWSRIELKDLEITLLFIFNYGGILRYDFSTLPTQKSNCKIILRTFEGFMIIEEIDLLYIEAVKSRNEKSIKDKLQLCAKYEITDKSDAESIMGRIHTILIEKFDYNKLKSQKEPSSASEALAQSSRLQSIKKENRKKYKALRKPANKTNEKLNAVLDLIINEKNVNSNNKDDIADSDQEIEKALNELGVLSNQDKDAKNDSDIEIVNNSKKKKLENDGELELKQDHVKQLNQIPPNVPQSSPASSFNIDHGGSSFYGGSAVNPHSQTPIYHAQRAHVFIDSVTSDKEMNKEDKEALTLAFYDEELKADIIPYFDSLCIQNKSFADMAASLLWLVKVLNMRKK